MIITAGSIIAHTIRVTMSTVSAISSQYSKTSQIAVFQHKRLTKAYT